MVNKTNREVNSDIHYSDIIHPDRIDTNPDGISAFQKIPADFGIFSGGDLRDGDYFCIQYYFAIHLDRNANRWIIGRISVQKSRFCGIPRPRWIARFYAGANSRS